MENTESLLDQTSTYERKVYVLVGFNKDEVVLLDKIKRRELRNERKNKSKCQKN